MVSGDGFLKVTLVALDQNRGKGNIRIEALSDRVGRIFVNVNFRSGERNTIAYRPGDVGSSGSLFKISTMTQDDKIVEIVLTPA